jgi:membrane protease YdiL (CAAX protease family)
MDRSDPAPPFPADLASRQARRQAAAVLVLFYGIVYGAPFLLRSLPLPPGIPPPLSALFIGTAMLLGVAALLRRDRSWRESLALRPEPLGRAAGWSLLGLVATYAVNLLFTVVYVTVQGDLELVASRRLRWLGVLAELPVEAILPLALFAGLWEEVVFRGFLLGRVRAAIPAAEGRGARLRRDGLAVLATAAAFGLGHGYQGLLGMLQTSLAGLVLGSLVVRRQSLWPAVGAHLAIDLFGLLMLQALKGSFPRP